MRVVRLAAATLMWAVACVAAVAEPNDRPAETVGDAAGAAPPAILLNAPAPRLSDGEALEVFKIIPESQSPEKPSAVDAPGAAGSQQLESAAGSAPEVGQATAPEKASAADAAAAVAPAPAPEPTLSIDVNLTSQRMTVTENGAVKYTWMISSAALGYRTPTGTFKPSWMARMWYSRQYDWSPMPHAIFFHNGVAIHATQALRQLGRPASHGCVRLAPTNAKALYRLVTNHGKENTQIVVHGTPRFAPTASRVSAYGYRPAGRRVAGAYYGGVYAASPSYYVRPPKRRAGAYGYQKPGRYVSGY